MSVYEKLSALSIAIPQLTSPIAAYVPFVRTGNHVFLSGHIAKKDGQPFSGQLVPRHIQNSILSPIGF
jgi:enamine deaminase RidA (YjgF/YER057c/UK114 family)